MTFLPGFPGRCLRTGGTRRCPAAVAVGMLRQLKSAQFPMRPSYAFRKTAFVIGDPDLKGWGGFPRLPGASKRRKRLPLARIRWLWC